MFQIDMNNMNKLKFIMESNCNHASDHKRQNLFKYHKARQSTEYNMNNNSSN